MKRQYLERIFAVDVPTVNDMGQPCSYQPEDYCQIAAVMIVSSGIPAFFARCRVSTTPTAIPRNMRMPCQPIVKEPNSAMLGSMPISIDLLL
jgi:hypothetical protein